MTKNTLGAVAFAVCAGVVGTAQAQDGLPLTVVGVDGVEHVLFLSHLDEMEQVTFSTSTIWTEGVLEFSGVSVRHILDVVNANGTTLKISALNDYTVEMPLSDLQDSAPIVATRINGEVMPVRAKGPYWIMFPFDENPEFQTEVRYAQSVWQLKLLAVTD